MRLVPMVASVVVLVNLRRGLSPALNEGKMSMRRIMVLLAAILLVLIHRSAWKVDSPKYASKIPHRPPPDRLRCALYVPGLLQAEHKILWCRIKLRNLALHTGRQPSRRDPP